MVNVGVIMGNKSDYKIMEEGLTVLQEFGVSYLVKSDSEDLPLDITGEWLKNLENDGAKVIIAGGGSDYDFAGKIAGLTTIPVISVPIRSEIPEDIESLFGIVQPGSPVATVGINNSRNAALLAVAVLGIADDRLKKALKDFREKMSSEVRLKDQKLQDKQGYQQT